MIKIKKTKVFVVTCVLDTGERVWFKYVTKKVDDNPVYYIGLLPEISYTAET